VVKTDLHTFKELLATPEPAALGPRSRAGTLSESKLMDTLKPLASAAWMPLRRLELIRALLLLWHDHLESAHTVAQSVEDADGNFIHAIMHRREPDAGNSKYWWRRVGDHAAFPELVRRVERLVGLHGDRDYVQRLVASGRWNAAAFVDACARAMDLPDADPTVKLLREIQRAETEVLLEHLLGDLK
jgi:hypothetical protein